MTAALLDPPAPSVEDDARRRELLASRATERALARALRGRTVIAIAHDLAVAQAADRVLVLSDGHLVEDGPHATLLQQGAAYARLWAAWSGSVHAPVGDGRSGRVAQSPRAARRATA